MVSLCFCTLLLKFIHIKENEYEQYIRNGDNLYVTEGVTWAQTNHWICCLIWPRVCITLWERQVQCTTWIRYEDLRQNSVIAMMKRNHEAWKSPVKTTKNSQTFRLFTYLRFCFTSSVFPWTLPWLQNGAEFVVKVFLFQLLLTPCSAKMCVSSLWKMSC